MHYDPARQIRCTKIRGKSISRRDDYLPVYAEILEAVCPVKEDRFAEEFDGRLAKYIQEDYKTIRNHRTENAGKLLGMFTTREGTVHPTPRTLKFLEDRDQPAFFKSVCFRFQQPNGSQKIGTVVEKAEKGICFRPYHFILALLRLADEYRMQLNREQIGYYVLNSLDVLQGKVNPETVMNRIQEDADRGFVPKVVTPGKAHSYSMQHINEQLDYLELANLIRMKRGTVIINQAESKAADLFIEALNTTPAFDLKSYDLRSTGTGKRVETDWQNYFGAVSGQEAEAFVTDINSLESCWQSGRTYPVLVGREGESFVLDYERRFVRRLNRRLSMQVELQGKTSVLGYDLASFEAGRGKQPDAPRYITVKTTKREHAPNLSEAMDTVFLTRNEWEAAKRSGSSYYIYRVYFTAEGTYLKIIQDPVGKSRIGALSATPVSYRMEFGSRAVDEHIRSGS